MEQVSFRVLSLIPSLTEGRKRNKREIPVIAAKTKFWTNKGLVTDEADKGLTWAALEAVSRSMLESAIAGVRFAPNSSAVEISKRIFEGALLLLSSWERAMLIMPSEGSRPIA